MEVFTRVGDGRAPTFVGLSQRGATGRDRTPNPMQLQHFGATLASASKICKWKGHSTRCEGERRFKPRALPGANTYEEIKPLTVSDMME